MKILIREIFATRTIPLKCKDISLLLKTKSMVSMISPGDQFFIDLAIYR
jgi:hypothetical protein